MRTRRRDETSASPPRRPLPCPLSLWRTREPTRIRTDEATGLAAALAADSISGDPRWAAARAGDPAAAVAVAIDQIRQGQLEGPRADLVMGNLVLLALAGDPTARVVLDHGLRALAREHPGRQRLPRLRAAWAGLAAQDRRGRP